jgi:hypothetical protein
MRQPLGSTEVNNWFGGTRRKLRGRVTQLVGNTLDGSRPDIGLWPRKGGTFFFRGILLLDQVSLTSPGPDSPWLADDEGFGREGPGRRGQ